MDQALSASYETCRRLHRRHDPTYYWASRRLPEHVRLTRAEPGCLSFEVTPTDDPLAWRVEERFTDRAAFDAHQRRTRASAWGAATAAIRRD